MAIDETTRRRAESIWAKDQSMALDARRLAQRAEAAKTARLKELRLAKEAADRLSGEGIHVARRKRRLAPAT